MYLGMEFVMGFSIHGFNLLVIKLEGVSFYPEYVQNRGNITVKNLFWDFGTSRVGKGITYL